MFETVAPETFQTRSRRLYYETLPLSLALHAIVIAIGIAAAVWNVAFPETSPRVSVAYSLIKIPDPPPPPQAPAPKPAAPVAHEIKAPVATPPPVTLAPDAAPTVIPDRIPVVIEPPPMPAPHLVALEIPATSTNGAGTSATNVAGDLAGKLHGTPGGIIFPDGRLHIDRDEKLPMDPVEQEYPHYPHEMQKKGIEDQVVVRYLIGTDGRVKDVDIIDHAKDPSFDDAAVDAIRKWRFHPMIKDGKRIEVVHELAINFQLVSR